MLTDVDRPDRHLAGVRRVVSASPGGCSRPSGQLLAVAEGWVRGPSAEPVDDPRSSALSWRSCWPAPVRTPE